MDEVKSENKELKEKLQFMAYEGVEYLSDKDQEESDGEQVEDTDVLAQQRQVTHYSGWLHVLTDAHAMPVGRWLM